MANWRRLTLTALTPLFEWLIYGLGRTLRIRSEGYEPHMSPSEAKIFASWHGRLFVCAFFLRGKGVSALVSPSRDGDLLSRLFDRLGLATIRGSTGRQGIRALIESISALKAGTSLALTPDGPRGPAEEVQDGVLAMAKKSGVPIVPMSSSAQRKSFVKSWDRFLVPMPFSRCVVVFGEPIIVEDMEVARVQLKQSMNEVQRRADELGK